MSVSTLYYCLHRETQGILACCNPIPPLVRQSLNEIHSVIKDARDKPLIKVGLTSSLTR